MKVKAFILIPPEALRRLPSCIKEAGNRARSQALAGKTTLEKVSITVTGKTVNATEKGS